MGNEIEVTLCNPHGKAAFPVVKVVELAKGEFYTHSGENYIAAISANADYWEFNDDGTPKRLVKSDGRWTAVTYWNNGNRGEFSRDTLDEILLHFWKYDNE